MQLDNNYAKYKFACDASGGQCMPGFERSGHFITSTARSSEKQTYNRFPLADFTICDTSTDVRIMPNSVAVGNLKQGFFTIGESLTLSERSLATTISGHTLSFVSAISGLIGTATNSAVSVRKATPIFKGTTVKKFVSLMEEWRATRNPTNSGIEMFINPAYQKIIGMGHEVVPLILKEVESNIDDWFWALKSITGADPVPPAHRGRLKLMAKDWLIWARKQGYQW